MSEIPLPSGEVVKSGDTVLIGRGDDAQPHQVWAGQDAKIEVTAKGWGGPEVDQTFNSVTEFQNWCLECGGARVA